MSVHTIVFVIIFVGTTFGQPTDLTLEPNASGEDVVLAAYSKLTNLVDHRFLIRIAYVESRFGTDSKTFRNDYFGGIWQVDESDFLSTKDSEGHSVDLQETYKEILDELNIDWTKVEWEDLLKPLYSLLAAHLKLLTTGLKIPLDVEGQARFWKMHYNNEYRNTFEFINAIRELEDCKASKIKCNIDAVIVLDGSGSIGSADFQRAKDFVVQFMDCVPSGTMRTGLIIFSEEIDAIIDLESDLSVKEKKSKILNANYPGLATNTHLGMKRATDWLAGRPDDTIPGVIIVLTDGLSSYPLETTSAGLRAKDYGISTFAIGVGPHVRHVELKNIAQSNNNDKVMQINSYETLSELLEQIQFAVCATAKRLKREVRVSENIGQNEISYYAYQVPRNGIKVLMETPLGETTGFYSYHMKTPSYAYNDGIIKEGFNYIPSSPNKSIRTKRTIRHWRHHEESNFENDIPFSRQVYISIEGVEETNNFTIEVEEIKPKMTTLATISTPTPTSTTTQVPVLPFATTISTITIRQIPQLSIANEVSIGQPTVFKNKLNENKNVTIPSPPGQKHHTQQGLSSADIFEEYVYKNPKPNSSQISKINTPILLLNFCLLILSLCRAIGQ